MTLAEPAPWLLLVAAAHLGFQLTVDLVVYPALGDVPDDRWAAAHEQHSRRIVWLVAALYAPLVVLLGWAVAVEPRSPGTWLALTGGLVAIATTAAVAAPAHGELAAGGAAARPVLMRRLDCADRVRTVGAVVCAVGALLLAA